MRAGNPLHFGLGKDGDRWELSDGDVEALVHSLPQSSSDRKQELFHKIIREWFAVDLPEHLSWAVPGNFREATRKFELAQERAREFLPALRAAIDYWGSGVIAAHILHAKGNEISQSEMVNLADQLENMCDVLNQM